MPRCRRRFVLSISALALPLLFVSPAYAQMAGDVAEIVVTARAETATKTDTSIAEVPQSLSVIGADLIAARGAIGVQEALRYTPGLRTEPNGADFRFDYVTLRGFGSTDFIDGMRQGESFYTARTESFNLERIEVLRGPSSVLYGQAAPGGIVNSLTKVPQFDFGGEAAVQYGSFDRKQAQVDLTGALNDSGTLAARFVGVLRDADNQVDFGQDDRLFLAPSLRFRSADERTDIILSGVYQRDRAASIASFLPVNATLLAPSRDRELRRGVYLGEPSHNFYDADHYSATLQATHRFGDAVTYSGRLRYVHSDTANGDIEPDVWNGLENPFLDAGNRILPRYRYDKYTDLDMVTTDHNLRFDFATGPLTHKLLVGIDYLRSTLQGSTIYDAAAPIDIYDPDYSPANVPELDAERDPNSRNTQLGLYVQDQIDYADVVTLVLGARRDRATSWSEGDAKQVDHATTFRAGLIVKPGMGFAPYVSYSESFNPITGIDFFGDSFRPQRGRQWEGGLRWQPDANMLLSAAYFDIKGSNLLATDPNNGENQIQVGTVRSRGFELEASRVLPGNYTITASYSHVKARTGFDTDPLLVGLPISAIPKDTASLWGEKSVALGSDLMLRIGLGVRYVGATEEAAAFYDVDPDGQIERLRTPGFTLADALLALEWKKWSLSVNATNLFDKNYYAQCSVRSACSFGYARNVIGTLGYRF
ncbi:iron complex outermembrane receptor protein [Sphingopyxis panaciterrae]|uniref:TonB-dependent siderophore receptor n=1 Tax=Sphingopyxis panaciterrae TaxID=363841 RepID=UPI00141F4F23|nr:TonB-dependent siderophore receptor [Sphingopyxis panaciterrae]NIJ38180.1 iron complex outermembrane receptor protein [Sphingopyxis panaciterrae]